MRFEDTKMKICTKKDIKFLTGVMAASLLLGGCRMKEFASSLENFALHSSP